MSSPGTSWLHCLASLRRTHHAMSHNKELHLPLTILFPHPPTLLLNHTPRIPELPLPIRVCIIPLEPTFPLSSRLPEPPLVKGDCLYSAGGEEGEHGRIGAHVVYKAVEVHDCCSGGHARRGVVTGVVQGERVEGGEGACGGAAGVRGGDRVVHCARRGCGSGGGAGHAGR